MTGWGRLCTAPRSSTPTHKPRDLAPHLLPLLAVLFLLSTVVPASARSGVELRSIRLGVTSERTRIVLDLNSGPFSRQHAMAGDTAMVVHLPGVSAASTFRAPNLPDGLVRSLRTRDAGRDGLELWFGFTARVSARVFTVAAEKGKPPRLVIDVVAKPGTAIVPAPKPPVAPPVAEPSKPLVKAAARPEPAPGSTPPDSASGPRRGGPRVIVIDPGHGGGDPGALGKGLREKDVCLDVARRLAAALNKTPGYRAVLTRQDDRRVALAERMRFAEREGADLFVSIHVNAARSSRATGAEVFFLSIGAATDRAAAELARLENEADPDWVVEEDEGLRGLPFAIDLRQSDTLLRSSRLAEVVLDVLTARGLAEPRGVKQAGFAVLKSYQVTSILVELGFISSPTERKKLKSLDHREKLAEALASGVQRYFDQFAPARAAP
jgi:N-acetylmuramoyl-L-alanine amidase